MERSKTELDSSLVLIKVQPVNSIIDDNNELTINGKLYDIEQRLVKGDSVYFYAYEDFEEETALSNIATLFYSDGTIVTTHKLQAVGHRSSYNGNDYLPTIFFTIVIHAHQLGARNLAVLNKHSHCYLTTPHEPPEHSFTYTSLAFPERIMIL